MFAAPDSVQDYVDSLEHMLLHIREAKAREPKYQRNDVEVMRRKMLKYRDEAARLRVAIKLKAIPKVPLKAEVAIDLPLRTSRRHLAMMDHLMAYGVSKSRYSDIYRLLKFMHMFIRKGKSWDVYLTFICLQASTVEYFTVSSIVGMLEHCATRKQISAKFARLVNLGYLKKGVYAPKTETLYFITDKGLEGVKEFTKELRSIKINIDCYGEVFKEAFRESQRPDGKASKAIRRSIDSVGEQVQRKLTRAKPSGRKSGIRLDRRADRFEER